jgi:hypothetical protein
MVLILTKNMPLRTLLTTSLVCVENLLAQPALLYRHPRKERRSVPNDRARLECAPPDPLVQPAATVFSKRVAIGAAVEALPEFLSGRRHDWPEQNSRDPQGFDARVEHVGEFSTARGFTGEDERPAPVDLTIDRAHQFEGLPAGLVDSQLGIRLDHSGALAPGRLDQRSGR